MSATYLRTPSRVSTVDRDTARRQRPLQLPGGIQQDWGYGLFARRVDRVNKVRLAARPRLERRRPKVFNEHAL